MKNTDQCIIYKDNEHVEKRDKSERIKSTQNNKDRKK